MTFFFFLLHQGVPSSDNIQREEEKGDGEPKLSAVDLKKCQKEQNLAGPSFHSVRNAADIRHTFSYSSNRFQGRFHFSLSDAPLHALRPAL